MQVNRQTRVANLNADFLDGKDSTSLGVNTKVFKAMGSFALAKSFTVPALAPGRYLISFNLPFQGIGSGSPSHPVMGACWAVATGTGSDQYTGVQTSTSIMGNPACSGSGQLVVESGDTVLVTGQLTNASEPSWSANASVPVEVALTRITATSTGSLSPAGRVAGRRPVG